MPWRVLQDGAGLVVKLGEAEDGRGGTYAVTRGVIGAQGQLITEDLAPWLVERYDAGEEHIRSQVQRVDDDGNPVDGEAPRAPANASADQKRVAELEAKLADAQASAAQVDYSKLSPEALEMEVESRGLTDQIEGTGKDGNVLKADRVKALTEDDEAKAKA